MMEVRVDSNRIRTERGNRGWTQGHLARVAGLSLRTIQRIEKTGSASFESVTALASVFSVEVTDLRAGEARPSFERAIRLSLELPVRIVLALVSGVLVALHFRWTNDGFWLDHGWLDDDSFHFAISGALFGATVLCPYLRLGDRLMLRALALLGASALSYHCAVWVALSADAWFSVAPVLAAYLLASAVGVTIVLVAARIFIPLGVTAAYWFLGLVASVAGGLAMYSGFEVFGDTTFTTIASYCAWHVLACIAIYGGHRSNDAHRGVLAAFMRTRGRFSIVPGWMTLSHSILR